MCDLDMFKNIVNRRHLIEIKEYRQKIVCTTHKIIYFCKITAHNGRSFAK